MGAGLDRLVQAALRSVALRGQIWTCIWLGIEKIDWGLSDTEQAQSSSNPRATVGVFHQHDFSLLPCGLILCMHHTDLLASSQTHPVVAPIAVHSASECGLWGDGHRPPEPLLGPAGAGGAGGSPSKAGRPLPDVPPGP
jgi:hypothetical protein